MSQDNTSLDLSEYFKNDDDSNGQRLAEYLQKRRGGGLKQDFVFLNYEPQRLSLKVQLEKLPPPQQDQETSEYNNKDNNNENNVINENVDKNIVEEKELDLTNPDKENLTDKLTKSDNPPLNNNYVEGISRDKVERESRALSAPPVSGQGTSSPSRLLSPGLSTIRKSGYVSPGDRLRRLSLKRLSKMCIGRRTLLQEFESTVSNSNFDPPVCSTPLSQGKHNKSAPAPDSIRYSETENMSNADEVNSQANNSCCGHTDTLIRTLQRKDDELKNYMDNLMESTLNKIHKQSQSENIKSTQEKENTQHTLHSNESPLKRTYTVEKELTAGQVIISPEKIPRTSIADNSRILRFQTHHLPDKTLKTLERNSIKVQNVGNISCSESLNKTSSQVEVTFKNSQCGDAAEQSNSNKFRQEVANIAPPLNNISIVLSTQDATNVEIPETQNNQTESNNTIEIHANNKNLPVLVIPVTQNLNRTNTVIGPAEKSTVTTETKCQKADINNTNQADVNQDDINKNKQNLLHEINEDNIKLTDILTDDEDEIQKTPVTIHSMENNQVPLNLAVSSANIRNKRGRKSSTSRRRLQMDNSPLIAGIEKEPPPWAHSNNHSLNRRRVLKRKKLTLNKPPGTPLNGERFAKELQRMSNYEILDLRKRNSLGRVFPISGRKSAQEKESVIKKRQQLDEQIDMELLRRNFQGDHSKQYSNDTEATNANAEIAVQDVQSVSDEYLPVPDEFRDSRESSLVDEKLTDRVTFKSVTDASNRRRSKRGKKTEITEELKQYLQVSELITQKTKKSYYGDQTKRSLYSQEHSDSPDKNSSQENCCTDLKRYSTRSRKDSLICLKSPPKSKEIITLKVVSPPPPITPPASPIRTEAESLQLSPIISPPPLAFDTDSRGINPNNIDGHSSVENIKQTAELADTENNSNKNDDRIFKKPSHPPPKRKVRKNKGAKIMSNTSEQTAGESAATDKSTDEPGSALRRSKRGHVPTQSLPIFQMLLEKTLRAHWEAREKQIKRQKVLKKDEQSRDGDTLMSSEKPKRIRTKKAKPTLETVPEGELLTTTPNPSVEISKKKAVTNKKSSIGKRNQSKNKQSKTSDEPLECAHLTLTTPPPIDHLNNVFDQLRNSSSVMNSDCPPHPTTANELMIPKVKPVRVRIARLKPSRTSSFISKAAISTANICQQTSNSIANITSTSSISYSSMATSNSSNYELISWLKSVTDTNRVTERNEAIFKEMRISAASNLSFTELQGVEYAFYDTEEKASLGYLRFKPRQKKPKKKAKRFHLHFVTLVGHFRITANNEETILSVGDMVAIEKTVYYDIENLTDDVGILMVIKK